MLIDGLSIEEHERFDEIVSLLDEREGDLKPHYWFCNDTTGREESEDYCYDCLKKEMPEAERGEHFMGGGCYEGDGCAVCEKCRELLQYTLTDWGVSNELSHFIENPPDKADLLNPVVCYELARIAHGISDKEQALKFISLFPKEGLDVKPD